MIEIKIIAEFRVNADQTEAFKTLLGSALVDTRSFEGCRSVDIYEDSEKPVFYALSDWDSHSDYDKYLAWSEVDPVCETGVSWVLVGFYVLV